MPHEFEDSPNITDGSPHWTDNPFRRRPAAANPFVDRRNLNDSELQHTPPPPRAARRSESLAFDLGDYADEYSRRVSGVPLGSWNYTFHDDDSGQTLVHSNGSLARQGPDEPGSSSRIAGRNRAVSGAQGTHASDISFPSPSLALQPGRTSRIPFPTPDPANPASPSSSRFPGLLSDSQDPSGRDGLVKRRQNFSSRDSWSDFDIHGMPTHSDDEDYDMERQRTEGGDAPDLDDPSFYRNYGYGYSTSVNRMRRDHSMFSTSSNEPALDPDDPLITGTRPTRRHAEETVEEKDMLRRMDYRSRRKHIQRVKIEFNVSSVKNRQRFVLKLARALMTFGAPSHRIESQLTAAARILEVQAEFIHLPGVIICSFGEQDTGASLTHFVKTSGRLSLGCLHKVHVIYRAVVHDEVSAGLASEELDGLLKESPIYSMWLRCVFAFWLAVLICPLAFGGSFVDMWFSGLAGLVLAFLQLHVANKSALYANVFEITVSIIVSFVARGLSSIRSQIFCYTAISSSGIIGILPGYLILSSSLELASKNIVNGSVKMVYALIYTLFLGFGLQIGNDFYLLLDPGYRHQLESLKNNLGSTVSIIGTWAADNGTAENQVPLSGTFSFSHTMTPKQLDIINGCYRPAHFPWYLQPFPLWTSFIIVPLFSIISSLANLQPLKSKQLPVMVVISCCSYAANKVANHYIFNRSDVVSAIGAFTVGLLGNVYSRKMGGTAFTSMVTGVLFLVPSGLSSAGGITANGNGIDIGGAMIAVTIGITVGLFMSQSLVYTFGSRKNAAVFSF